MSFNMRENWDAIVIGAGIGGLTAAAHLVKAGLNSFSFGEKPPSRWNSLCLSQEGIYLSHGTPWVQPSRPCSKYP